MIYYYLLYRNKSTTLLEISNMIPILIPRIKRFSLHLIQNKGVPFTILLNLNYH